MWRHRTLPAALAVLLTAGASVRAEELAYILDSGAKQLVELDLASGRRVRSVPLTGNPAWLDDDGRYVLAFDRGPGEPKGDRGYQATGQSSVTIVEAATLRSVGRVELGNGSTSSRRGRSAPPRPAAAGRSS